MSTVVEYLADQSSLELGPDGFQASEMYLITGLTGDAAARKVDALTDPRLPALFDAHPRASGTFVQRKRAQPAAGDGADMRVEVLYAPFGASGDDRPPSEADQGVIEVGGTVEIERTTLDAAGQPMILRHTYDPATTAAEDLKKVIGLQDDLAREVYTPLGLPAPEDLRTRSVTTWQRVTAEVYQPATVVRVTRVESASPLAKSLEYRRTVNALPIWGGARRTWLCTELRGVSNDGGLTYAVTYEFTFRARTWDFAADFISASTNEPVRYADGTAPDPTYFQVYPEANFASLRLDL